MSDRLKGRKTLRVGGILDEFEKDEVKRRVDIVDLFAHFKVDLKQKGKSWIGLCPWHDDKNPSLSVDQNQKIFNCFGCGESGDIFTLAGKMKGIGFKEALLYLKGFTGMTAGEKTKEQEKTDLLQDAVSSSLLDPGLEEEETAKGGTMPVPKDAESGKESGEAITEEEPLKRKDPDIAAVKTDDPGLADKIVPEINLDMIAEYYHKRLFDNPKAMEYLRKRGITDPELIKRFRIGFCDGSLTDKLHDDHKRALRDPGILRDNSSEHFFNCLTFPILNDLDFTAGFYARNISDTAKVKHLYLKGKHKGVFNRQASKVYEEIILTEGTMDALSLMMLGFLNAQAVYGVNGFTEEHLQALKDGKVKRIVIAFDADEAGRKASEDLKEKLVSESFEVKEISPPAKVQNNGSGRPCKDWNEYLLSGSGKDFVETMIEKAEVSEPILQEQSKGLSIEKTKLGYLFTLSDISYQVSGVKESFVSSLRVNIKAELIENRDEKYYDNLDLYSARSRSMYAVSLSRLFNMEQRRIEKDLIMILEYLIDERDQAISEVSSESNKIDVSPEDEKLGMEFLRSPDFRSILREDLRILGYVGEDLIKELMYYAATSRLMANPVSVLIISQSASGKSLMLDTVKKLIPPEDVIWVTSLSEQALNYAEDLMHKFLVLGEAVHSEIVQHQIREMLSSGELSRFVTVKDKNTGELVSKAKPKPVKVAVGMTGTRDDMNPENLSRFFMVNMDESREQTRRIHKAQREKYSLERYHEQSNRIPLIIRKHHAAQRLLRPRIIENRFRSYLDFPYSQMRTRRDNERFVDLVALMSFFRQYQKEVKVDDTGMEYIESDFVDYEIAYDIMVNGVLSSTLMEIPRGTYELYEEVRNLSRKLGKEKNLNATEVSFTQRDVREYTGCNHTWVKRSIRILIDYEYIYSVKGGGSRSKGFYRLRGDEPIDKLDISMIPEPGKIREIMDNDI